MLEALKVTNSIIKIVDGQRKSKTKIEFVLRVGMRRLLIDIFLVERVNHRSFE